MPFVFIVWSQDLCSLLHFRLEDQFLILLLDWVCDPGDHLLGLALAVDCHQEDELGSLARLRSANDVAVEDLGDLLGDMETQTNTFGIYLLGVVQEPEYLEQLLLILITDANSCITDGNFQEALVVLLLHGVLDWFDQLRVLNCEVVDASDELADDVDVAAGWGELDCI